MSSDAPVFRTSPPPRSLNILMTLWFLSFGIVLFEPAPFDMLFAPMLVIALASYPLLVPRAFGFLSCCLLLFVLANLLSMLVADDATRGVFYLLITLYILMFALFIGLMLYNYGYELLHVIMRAYMIIAVLSAVLGIMGVMKLLPGPLGEIVTLYAGTRARAFFKDTNVYSPFLILPMIYALDQCWSGKGGRLRWGALICVLGLGVLVSFSRAAWISALAAMVGYALLSAAANKQFSRLISSLVSFAGIGAVGLVVLLLFAKQTNMLDFIEQRSTLQEYDTGRFENQQRALRAGFSHVFGIGPGQSEILFFDAFPSGAGATHSLYVRTIAEYGVLGALALLGILYATAAKALRLCFTAPYARRSLHCVFAVVFFASLITSFVIDTLHWRHFFLDIGIIWGLSALEERRRMVER